MNPAVHTARLVLLLAAACTAALPSLASDSTTVRFATFNASLNRDASGQLLSDLGNPQALGVTSTEANRILQARNVAEILQRVNADVVLVNEFDFDVAGSPSANGTPMPLGSSSQAAALFQSNFLSSAQGNAILGFTQPLTYAHRYTPNTNTGIASGFDLNNNGTVVTTPGAPGFGR